MITIIGSNHPFCEVVNHSRCGQEGSVFNEPHLPDALRTARAAAGGSDGEGFVVSLPQLFHARVSADFDNEIWNNCPPPSPPLHPLCSVDPESR